MANDGDDDMLEVDVMEQGEKAESNTGSREHC
jgi:hypothetical protein